MNNIKRVSSKDVAKEAGVSQATVSYVMNNCQNVKIKPETKELVLNAAKKLNYHPNHIARGMKLNKSMAIGVVTNRNFTNLYFAKVLEGININLSEQNYAISLFFDKENESSDVYETDYIKHYNANRLDGLIFIFEKPNDKYFASLKEMGVPFVSISNSPSENNIHEVCTNMLEQLPELFDILKLNGKSRITYIGIDNGNNIKNMKNAVEKVGMELNETKVLLSIDSTEDEIRDEIRKLLPTIKSNNTVIAAGPRYAFETLRVAYELGIKIPEEISLVSLGSSLFYRYSYPSLTAMEAPLSTMGRHAVDMLIDIINGKEVEKSKILKVRLIERESCKL